MLGIHGTVIDGLSFATDLLFNVRAVEGKCVADLTITNGLIAMIVEYID